MCMCVCVSERESYAQEFKESPNNINKRSLHTKNNNTTHRGT